MNILLRGWSAYTRMTLRWPSLAAIVPFIPVIALWVALGLLLHARILHRERTERGKGEDEG